MIRRWDVGSVRALTQIRYPLSYNSGKIVSHGVRPKHTVHGYKHFVSLLGLVKSCEQGVSVTLFYIISFLTILRTIQPRQSARLDIERVVDSPSV